ncbi:MAG: hypothetical protein AABZ47_08685 [Planctomycetota bacterium]
MTAEVLAQQTASISLSVAPPADTSITGNEQIAVEAFVTFSQNGRVKGAQIGFFCTITNGSTSLTTNGVDSVSNPLNSANGTPSICVPGLHPVHQISCFAATSPLPGQDPCPIVANTIYFIGKITYDVSDCASDPVDVHAEPLGVADGVPQSTDKTRFRDDGPGTGALIPIVAETFTTLVPDVGTCCVDGACAADGVNEYCCEQGLYGGLPGEFHTDHTSCAESNPCQCATDVGCDDGVRCNGVETCNVATGQCMPPVLLLCDDEDPCTIDSCNEAAPGDPCLHNAASGFLCGSSAVTQCDDPDRCLNGVCQQNHKPEGFSCGNSAETQCHHADFCAGGICITNNLPNGAPCGSSANGDCDHPDYCSSGSCQSNLEQNGSLCSDDGSPCTNDLCDTGTCIHPPNPLLDGDADGLCDSDDNCPAVSNSDQTDADNDSVGDACDVCPGQEDLLDSDANGTPDCLQFIPTTSTWGMIVLALVLLVGAKVTRFNDVRV